MKKEELELVLSLVSGNKDSFVADEENLKLLEQLSSRGLIKASPITDYMKQEEGAEQMQSSALIFHALTLEGQKIVDQFLAEQNAPPRIRKLVSALVPVLIGVLSALSLRLLGV